MNRLLVIILLIAIGVAIYFYEEKRIQDLRESHSTETITIQAHYNSLKKLSTDVIQGLQNGLNKATRTNDSSLHVIGRLNAAIARISLKHASPALLDSVRTVLVPPGPKTDTTYCIDLAEARDLYEIKAKEPLREQIIKTYAMANDSLSKFSEKIRNGLDSLSKLNQGKDSVEQAMAIRNEELEEKLDRPFGFGPHIGWDVRNQITAGVSVQYSLFRFRLWKKKRK